MDELNLIEIRKNKTDEINSMIDAIKTENRKFSKVEENYIEQVKTEIQDIDRQIEDKKNKEQKNNIKNMEKFSLLKTIRDIVDNRPLNETAIEMIDKGRADFMKAGQTTRGQILLPFETRSDIKVEAQYAGQEIVAEDKFSMLGALRAKTVLGQAGATFYTGLVGDVSIPVYAGSSVGWAYEVSGATDGGSTFSEVTLSPKRLTGYIDISKQFLLQDSISAEQGLYSDLIDAILVKVENTVFDATAGTAQRPAGIYYNATLTGVLTGTTSYAKLVGIKAAVDTANALTGKLAWITNPTLGAVLETTTVDTGSGIFCMQNGKINGYPVYITSNIPTIDTSYQGIIFGNWADYVVGQWGGMDITVDPYSQAIYGKVRLVVNTYWDFKPRRSASFKLGKLA